MTPASKPSAAALRYAAPVSDALYAINERGLDCAPIRGEDPAPIDSSCGQPELCSQLSATQSEMASRMPDWLIAYLGCTIWTTA